ncbi:MAG TPA: transketolase [Clostridia bacterium]|nr:transketolase [Clostridia bacterium]
MEAAVKKQLAKIALDIRTHSVEAVYYAKSGHPGGSLSVADVLAYLYFEEMRVDSKNPGWEDRDRLVLSKGHCTPALYSALSLKGFFPVCELKNFRKLGHMLQGHPDMKKVPGVDMSTGSLGQGISAACGMALSAKLSKKDYRVYTVLGDGELEEGQVWEAAMFAAHYKLDNLCALVDFNCLQIDGDIRQVMSPLPIAGKFEQFGWNVIEIDAHDFEQIDAAYKQARCCKGRPTVIVARSVKGKGVSFMENAPEWHGSAPNQEQFEQAMSELEAANKQLEG